MSTVSVPSNFNMQRYKNGVKINPGPGNAAELFHQEFNSFILDEQGRTLKINESGAVVIGFDSSRDALGRTILCVSADNSGKALHHNTMRAFYHQKTYILEEDQVKLDGSMNSYLTIKMPCYHESDRLFGIYGCSILLGKHPLLPSLEKLSPFLPDFKLSTLKGHYQQPLSQFNLSQRQQQCLLLAIRGKTAKESAKIMGLSYRTIEEYLQNARLKMAVSSKKEMIEKTIDLIAPDVFKTS